MQSFFVAGGLQAVHEHPKGHALPCRAEDVDAVVRFLSALAGRGMVPVQSLPTKARRPAPERRYAPDGMEYTKSEFVSFFLTISPSSSFVSCLVLARFLLCLNAR